MTSSGAGAVGVCLLVLLAGCGGGAPRPTDTVRLEGGRVEGRVLDEAIAPIADATVRILLTSLTASTDDEGGFIFINVPAGPIRAVASAEGFASQTRSANLTQGGLVVFQFVLSGAPRVTPFNKTTSYRGEIRCGLPSGISCNADPVGGETTHPFLVDAYLRGMVIELVWTPPGSGVNERLAFDVRAATASACGDRYNGREGRSPLRLEVTQGFPVAGGHQCLVVRSVQDAATVTQSYTSYVTLFYHEPPPPGFSAVPRS